MEELYICKYCGVETTQPDDECYAKPAKTMTAVEQFFKDLVYLGYIEYPNENLLQNRLNLALEMEKQQIKSAFIQGDMFSVDYYDGINQTDDNYYNETYKKDTNGTH